MGAGASTVAGVKATVAAASVDDLKACFRSLTPEELGKVRDACKDDPGATGQVVPERLATLMQNRVLWEAGRAKFYGWLGQHSEEALEPDLEIVDPHHHVWDMRELKGYNLFGIFKQQYYMTDELADDFIGGGHNVTHSVFVTTHAFFKESAEPAYMVALGEVEFVQGVAAQFASGKYGKLRACAGIIGAADLSKYGAEVEPLLIACKAASPNYRGIRCNAAHDPLAPKASFHPTAGMYAEAKFREGFALLGKHGLVFDAWLFASQLGDLYDLAMAFPETTIVLNHIGTPIAALGDVPGAADYDGKQADVLAQWKEKLVLIAKDCPKVFVKVGGWGLPQIGHGLAEREKPPSSEEVAALFKDAYLWTIETFGAQRCMFEGNFPVDKVSMSYTVLWNAYKRMTKEAGLSENDRALLFSGTAKRVYRL